MTGELPLGWASASLGEIAEINPRHPKGLDDSMTVTFVPMAALSESKPEFQFTKENKLGSVRKGFTQFADGDVLFAKITPCMENGKGAVAAGLRNGLGCGTTEVHIIRPLAGIPPHFLYYFLAQTKIRSLAKDSFTGTAGQSRVPATFVEQVELPLAPLPEQQRIVQRLQKILPKVDECQDRLAKIPVLLKRFRQSILAAGFSGRLTADWRKENAEPETGATLIDRIREKRRALAGSTKEKNQIDEAFEAEVATTNDELNIPESWIACHIGAIATVVNGSTPSRKNASFWLGDIPWVSSGEVRNNVITTTREQITKAGYENSSVRMLPPGTVLLAMIGEGKTRGQTAVLQIEATINQNIAAILLTHGLVEPRFLWRWFQFQYEATRERGSGSGPQALNCQRVRELPCVLPPLGEQTAIVRRIESFLALADRIEARYKEAHARTNSLGQSILAKAFHGELVPTEAQLAEAQGRSFESAEELLERIEHINGIETKKERRDPSRAKRAAV
jgi:type I restriction enzyme S subunit